VDVLVGPPYPDPMPFADVQELPDDQFWGKWFVRDFARFFPADAPLRVFEPLRFWELGASRMGFLPEPFAASARAFRVLARRLRAGRGYDVVHDVQCLGWGMLGVRALGLPVVTTVHHPLSVDRRASFQRDRSLREALGTMEFYPVGMQAFVARRLDRVITSSAASASLLERDFGVRRERLRMLGNGLDTDLFRPDPRAPRAATELVCVARASDPNKGVARLVEALARLPRPVRLTLVDQDHALHEAKLRARALGCEDRVHVTGRALPPRHARGGAVALRGLRASRRGGDGVRHARGGHARGRAPRSARHRRRRDPGSAGRRRGPRQGDRHAPRPARGPRRARRPRPRTHP
jgi:glycosyltransferase involved in cell wall biosynthesis